MNNKTFFGICGVYAVVVLLTAFFAYGQGHYDGLLDLCPEGVLAVDKNQDYHCYTQEEFNNLNQAQNIWRPYYDYNKTQL